MSHQKLQFQALEVLSTLPQLDNPILLCFNGQWVLSHQPSERLSDLQSLKNKRATRSVVNPGSATDTKSAISPNKHFQSGWAGTFAYPDIGQALDAEFYYYPASLLLDTHSGDVFLQNPNNLSEHEIKQWLQPLQHQQDKPLPPEEPHARQWQAAWNKDQYQQAFQQVQEYLKSGDCYQINLTMPFYCDSDLRDASPLPLLTSFNPRFGGYFKTEQQTLFSVSPERFIRVDGQRIETSPIKGTLPRGQSQAEDQQLAEQLSSSLKNQAENLMIVDLLRNDLSINATPHSVKAEKLFALESHANVHHLVSTISAEKRPDKTAADVILDAFPGGSITGAPKRRAMEIIEELECQPRGLYCGSLGYFDDAGHADFNILIRSIVATQDGATCWGGGGVTVDSTADDEYQEIMNKVGKILATPI